MTHTTTERLQDAILRRTMYYSNEQLDALAREIAAERIEEERVRTNRPPQFALTYSGYVIFVKPDETCLNVRAVDNCYITYGWTVKL